LPERALPFWGSPFNATVLFSYTWRDHLGKRHQFIMPMAKKRRVADHKIRQKTLQKPPMFW
jgi:hypothetical protein